MSRPEISARGPSHGWPLPWFGRVHPYAWTCCVLTAVAVVLTTLPKLARALVGGGIMVDALAHDLGALALATYVVGPLIGLHALVKARWPGRTATEIARKPTRRDVYLVLGCLAVGLLNRALLVRTWSAVGPVTSWS